MILRKLFSYIVSFLKNKKFQYFSPKIDNSYNKTIFSKFMITGSNSGIGHELTKVILKDNKKVLATYNKEDTNLKKIQNSNLFIEKCDFGNFDEIKNLRKNNIFKDVDVIIHCAATRGHIPEADQIFENIDYEQLFKTYKVNALSFIELIKVLIDTNSKNIKLIINLSSWVASNKKNKSGGMYIYRTSKNLLNSISKNLSVDIKKYFNCKIVVLHPGNVKTKMNENGELDASSVAKRIYSILSSEKILELDGKFIDLNMNEFPW